VDDYGLDPSIDEAALRLVVQGRVSAISCMTRMPRWPAAARALAGVSARADIGLHLDFTQAGGAGLRRSLGQFIAAAYLGRLSSAALRDEVRAQLDAFEDAVGATPDFIDGHQHVHQLPGVREALMQELVLRYAGQRPWLRNTQPPTQYGAACRPSRADACKHGLIATLGARKFTALAQACGFPTNRHLLGVYGFEGSLSDHEARLACWCAQAGAGDLLMSHPATAAMVGDPIGNMRLTEYAALRSMRFGELLNEFGLRIARLSGKVTPPPAGAGCRFQQPISPH
jgi:predicted glycoside hydrolase/deacetylase ChbG (UPF0249 family)